MKAFASLTLILSGIATPLFAADSTFYEEAAMGGMAEVALGRLASAKAASDSVKTFGRQMVTDHEAANTKLKAAASKSKVTLPAGVSADAQATQKKLAALSGPEFDKAYLESQVKDHAKTIALLEKEIASGTDANAKAWATETLPTVKQHASMIDHLDTMSADHGKSASPSAGAPAPR